MKIKTSEATPRQLDWLVAKLEFDAPAIHGGVVHAMHEYMPWAPSTDWNHGMPIVERECMASSCFAPLPESMHYDPANPTRKQWFFWTGKTGMVAGPTLLIAAMRCYVASKLGDEVDVPEELT